jgi:hypothetical protein
MPRDYAVFVQEGQGTLWWESFTNAEEAARRAQELAVTEGLECFVYSFATSTEVARFCPHSGKPATLRPVRNVPPGLSTNT